MKNAIALLFLALACATAEPRSADPDRFAAAVLREIPDLPSVGVAAVKDGRVVYL